jgi:hypothetical protein
MTIRVADENGGRPGLVRLRVDEVCSRPDRRRVASVDVVLEGRVGDPRAVTSWVIKLT